jgi:glycosyltransferase involved in cell wall biosynthesis
MADAYPTLLVAGIVDTHEADLTALATERGVHLQIFGELGRRVSPWQDLVALAKLVALLRRTRPALVHTHTAKAGTLGRIAAVLAGVPVRVHTFHGHVFRGYFGRAATRVVVGIERALARTTTCVVTISDSQAREIVDEFRICSADRVRVIPLGLELEQYAPEALAPLRGEFRREIGAGDAAIVTIVGRLVPIKNHPLFLRMAARLRAEGRDCVFVVVGGGEETHLRQLAAELGIADRFRFLGWRSDLARIYADTDVVVLTSDNEGTPVCLIEALSAGCGVASTDVGGVRDVLDDGAWGVLAPAGDDETLARGVAGLLDDPASRREVGARSSRAIPQRFGVGRLLADMTALYDDLLGRSSKVTEPNHPLG